MLDAPCTGIGTLREHPEIKWRLKPADSARMAALQSRMLEHAAELVRRGGAIVYSVCSIAPEEGDGVVDRFLAIHGDFAIDRSIAAGAMLKDVVDARGFMRTQPDIGGLDGFFAARMIRR
jgi:16S rRNA (cytosine967-C5)-methyltransferase